MNTPLVSVLMTAYNREPYIAEAIKSVLASSFADFELIIVDDGSRDRTVEIAREFLSDARVQLHLNATNLGDYPNRNRAAGLARGKYLKYLDSDDLIYPHGLAVMVAAMEQFPEAALGMCRPASPAGPYPACMTPHAAYAEHFLGNGLLDCGPTGTIVRTRCFREAGGFSGKRYVGDLEMWIKLAARWQVVQLPEGLIWWRMHAGQEYQTGTRSHDYFMVYAMVMEALAAPDCPLSAEERGRAVARKRRRHARDLLRLAVRERQPRAAWRIMQATHFQPSDLLCAFRSPP
jgi:hypothetical protein